LLNIWIQKQNNTFQISPLIYDIGENNLTKEVVENVHKAIARTILSTKIIDRISASRCIISFIKGNDFNNAGLVLLTTFQTAKTVDEVNYLNDWGYLYFWSDSGIPNQMNIVLRVLILQEQLRMFHLIGKDTSRLIEIL
jgi:hypothetical protein